LLTPSLHNIFSVLHWPLVRCIAVNSGNREIECLSGRMRGIKMNTCTQNTETTASGIPVPCVEPWRNNKVWWRHGRRFFVVWNNCPLSVLRERHIGRTKMRHRVRSSIEWKRCSDGDKKTDSDDRVIIRLLYGDYRDYWLSNIQLYAYLNYVMLQARYKNLFNQI